ncbi:MAG TPA: hypothetical protein VLB76_25450 [Thermoanaerobaculia bacterium]|jgi:hypothetical protein|nr:hypothetical protein [Thermoanaerobaculia bacterium]
MKRIAPGLVALCLLGLAGPATATTKVAPEPAATLLLPYFEVDLGNQDGRSTLLSINNASPQAVLAHVVVWSDLSVPVLDYNIYLTGYDVQTLNLRELLVSGVLPRTASAGQDPTDTISPQGSISEDIDFASCTGLLPPPVLPASFVQHLQRSLTGQSSSVLGNRCAGRALGDNVARGYVTVDTVNNCTLRFPGDPGYFAADGSGDATEQNVLWGDYFYVDSSQNFADGNTLVHILAEEIPPPPTDFISSHPYTFYGRYVGWSGADKRHPLATNFAVRYVNGGTFTGGTSLIVWRDSKTNQAPFTCPATPGVRPGWYLLGQEKIVIFDEEEHPYVPLSIPSSPQQPQQSFAPFPAETQRVMVGGANFPVPFDFGWLYLNLNTSVFGVNEPTDTAAAQAWVAVKMSTQGRFSVGFDAIQIDNASRARHQTPAPP